MLPGKPWSSRSCSMTRARPHGVTTAVPGSYLPGRHYLVMPFCPLRSVLHVSRGMCIHKRLHETRALAGCHEICIGHGLCISLNIYRLVMSLVIRVPVRIVLLPFLSIILSFSSRHISRGNSSGVLSAG